MTEPVAKTRYLHAQNGRRLSVCRVLRPRGDTIQLHRSEAGNRSGPVGLVVSSESCGDRECITVAVFARSELIQYAKKRMTSDRT